MDCLDDDVLMKITLYFTYPGNNGDKSIDVLFLSIASTKVQTSTIERQVMKDFLNSYRDLADLSVQSGKNYSNKRSNSPWKIGKHLLKFFRVSNIYCI